ncbi:hypothetical protein [Streptomyces sp. MST-110588]|uniref:hypothetical protein n=1 Tax=Streptomyces sp. MST-110588 TaxID=2833628 RepID=UPI001F5C1B5E|nr:hypothetical protein [Streptomyces sp. MST-110588]UNO41164.1 hypothetical protein KGS77_18200 [Streptomyces sp. MST-110588]
MNRSTRRRLAVAAVAATALAVPAVPAVAAPAAATGSSQEVRSVELYRGTEQEAAQMRVALCVKRTGALTLTVTARALAPGQDAQGACMTVQPPQPPGFPSDDARTVPTRTDATRAAVARVAPYDYNAGEQDILVGTSAAALERVQIPLCTVLGSDPSIVSIVVSPLSPDSNCATAQGSDLSRLL